MRRFISGALIASIFVAGCALDADPGDGNGDETATQSASLEQGRFHCVAPWGIDWNEVLGVDDADIINDFCATIHRGDIADRYTPEVLWFTNTDDGSDGQPVVYPDGYVPAFRSPILDFVNKLDRVRYVVQPGGQEYTFRGREIMVLVTLADLFKGSSEFPPAQLVRPAVSLIGKLPSLPPGIYSADIHFIMTTTHCDGLTTDRAMSCLPPGDTLVKTRPFRVVP